jgi:hypothetical protein
MSEEIQESQEQIAEPTKSTPKKFKWSAEKVMSISALFVSAISLFALFYQLNLAREENELIRKEQKASVLPHLSQWIRSNNKSFSIVFGNRGVGPAFIKKVQITVNDSISFDNTDDTFNYIFSQMESTELPNFESSTFTDGRVIPAGESVITITIEQPKTRQFFLKYMNENSLEYNIIYEDIYGTRWSLSSKSEKAIPILLTQDEE